MATSHYQTYMPMANGHLLMTAPMYGRAKGRIQMFGLKLLWRIIHCDWDLWWMHGRRDVF